MFCCCQSLLIAVLRSKWFRYVKVEEADETTSSYMLLLLEMATSFSGDTINWQTVLEAEEDRRSLISLEDGHWILRDGHGRIYHRQ